MDRLYPGICFFPNPKNKLICIFAFSYFDYSLDTTPDLLNKPTKNAEFSRSSARQQRLKRLVSMGHEWELRVGFDAPLMMTQQHSFALTKGSRGGTREERLHASAQWLVDTGIDFLQTQQGTTEVRYLVGRALAPSCWVACCLCLIVSKHGRLTKHGTYTSSRWDMYKTQPEQNYWDGTSSWVSKTRAWFL